MSNPATTALHTKLDELGRSIHGLESQLAQLQADRATIASALAILDSDGHASIAEPLRLDPLGLAHGRFARTVLDVLRRAKEPMAPREIAEQLIRDRGLDTPDKAATNHIVQRVRNALTRMRGKLAQENRGTAIYWSVAGRIAPD